MNNLAQIKDFERELDKQMDTLTSLIVSGEQYTKLLLAAYEATILESWKTHKSESKAKGIASFFKRSLDSVLPKIINTVPSSKKSEPMRVLGKDKSMELYEFFNNYYIIRELLYYTYNSPESIRWSFKNNRVKIRFKDNTIPWQMVVIDNNYKLKSKELYDNSNVPKDSLKIFKLLSTTDEFVMSKEVAQALDLISKEVEIKINSYYNFFEDMENVPLGTYTVQQFKEVFNHVLGKALYHRYYSSIKNSPIPVCINIIEFVKEISYDTGISEDICKDIIMDISYTHETKAKNIQPMHCCLYYFEEDNNIWMSPNIVCIWEAFVNILRISAIKYPKNFQTYISSTLSRNFTSNLMEKFQAVGFHCIPNVKLTKLDARLPDIDLLVISHEPSLGYVLYCIEVKNQIPAIWSKDHIKVLNQGEGISKGISQIKLINDFINTDEGINYLYQLIPKQQFPESFNGEFLVLVRSLIVSSFNTGMFFSHESTDIIDYHSLERLISKSDGDIAYIMNGLKFYKNPPEDLISTVTMKFKCGNIKVDFEFPGGQDKIFDFPEQKWNTDGYSDQLLKEYLDAGYHPFMYISDKLSEIEKTNK